MTKAQEASTNSDLLRCRDELETCAEQGNPFALHLQP